MRVCACVRPPPVRLGGRGRGAFALVVLSRDVRRLLGGWWSFLLLSLSLSLSHHSPFLSGRPRVPNHLSSVELRINYKMARYFSKQGSKVLRLRTYPFQYRPTLRDVRCVKDRRCLVHGAIPGARHPTQPTTS